MSTVAWPVEHVHGSAAAFHERVVEEPPGPAIWWFEVARPALILGSTQHDDVVDRRAADAAGVDVVRRRSGGGAVHLEPGGSIWVDVVLPATDPRWDHDVGRSFGWLGRAWAAVLADLGRPDAQVHEGPMRRGPWSELVCFAGLGRGEVTIDQRKLVGISQRRTRSHARFQCVLYRAWEPTALLALLDLSAADRAPATRDLVDVACGLGDLGLGAVPAVEVVERLREHVS